MITYHDAQETPEGCQHLYLASPNSNYPEGKCVGAIYTNLHPNRIPKFKTKNTRGLGAWLGLERGSLRSVQNIVL